MPKVAINLEALPKHSSDYYWADFFELLVLQNSDRELSKADLFDRIMERKDLGETEIISGSDSVNFSNQDDKLMRFINDCFVNLNYRVGEFADAYPFTITEKGKSLRCKDQITPLQKLYIFFLLASNLRYISPQDRSEITSMFEVISHDALKSYFPPTASTILFGTNPYNKNVRFSGKLIKKIINLAEDLHERPLVIEEDFDPKDSGDSGLDVVAYIPFHDKAEGMFYAFGQCACTDDWINKQFACSEEAWQNKITFASHYPHMIFIPFCFRDSIGNWFNPIKISKSIVVDRVRLIHPFKLHPEIIDTYDDLPSVEYFLKTVESVF